ncbi:MAG: hypothetical protein PHT69_06965 [Bacteroidales bacterium]|nr:hypothetical protein [Bacteroidales bacterium]
MKSNNHIWQFARIGGINRVNLVSGKDLLALEHLDKKLWTALSCPVYGLEIDSKTLQYIDVDEDKRLRVPEIIEAVKWITSIIRNSDELIARTHSLPLKSINDDLPEGKVLLASANQILRNLGKSDADFITVEDTSDTIRIFANTKFNGDGVITEDSTDDESLKQLIRDIIFTIGSVIDRSDKPGVTSDIISDFYSQCLALSEWHTKSENDKENILPFGENTAEAYKIYNELKDKVEDFFVRCRLAAYDSQSAHILNNLSARLEALSERELNEKMSEIASFPLAHIEAGKNLPLDKGLNPAWEKLVLKFKHIIVESLLLKNESLSEVDWLTISSKFDAYTVWMSEKAGVHVEALGLTRVRDILKEDYKEKLLELVEEDKALESEAQNIFKVDKLVRFYRDIFTLLNNYVSFHDFYSQERKAVFQAGRLFIDQRSCDLCIKVNDMPKHSLMAGYSGICLIYCECYSKVKNEKMTILAGFTNGDFDDIIVGRNAVFFDNNGLDWDATIIKVIENPISIRQAFWSPYKKFARLINKQIEKFASDKEKAADEKMSANVEKSAQHADAGLAQPVTPDPAAAPPAPVAPPPPFDIGKFVGIFAAIGLALGAIGSILLAIISGFLNLAWWQMPIALVGVMLAISGPSMILAWLKLRKRNLAPVLDANGWAINSRVKINIPFGNTLTHLAKIPANSTINRIDPFKSKKNPWWVTAIIALVIVTTAVFLMWYFKIWLF